jgi:hypothetical protein
LNPAFLSDQSLDGYKQGRSALERPETIEAVRKPHMPSSWTLVVETTWSHTLDLEFKDRASLVGQLAIFKQTGLSNPYRLHEFRNEKGILIAFISKAYIAHSVNPSHVDFQ